MGDLTVTGLDEAVLRRLSQRAAEHGQSVEAEVKQVLTSSVLAGQEPATLAMLADARQQTAATVKSNTLDLIREGRDELA